MKKLMLVVAVLCAAGWARSAEVESLVGQGAWAFWLKPEAKVTSIGEDTTGIGGVQVGTSLGRSLYIGLGYNALLGSVDIGEPQVAEMGAMDLWYTGFCINYTLDPSRLVHLAFDVFVGGGAASVEVAGGGSDRSSLFVVEPGAAVLLNLAPDVELGLSAGYRVVSGVSLAGADEDDFSGATAGIFLRFTETR
jgi:hypothetical protein